MNKYAKIAHCGHLRKAVCFITDRDGGHVLSPEDINSKLNQPVKDVMDGKHPRRRDIDANHLEEYEELPKFQEVVITGEMVERVAKKLSGSGGLVNFDSIAMKHLLLNHGNHSA